MVKSLRGYTAPFLCSILEYCPALKKLTLPSLNDLTVAEAISRFIGNHCLAIFDLMASKEFQDSEEIMVDIMESLQGPQLESIGVCRLFEGLEVLGAQDHAFWNNAISLEDAVVAEWVSTRIRVLKIAVKFTPDGREPKYLADPMKATWSEEDYHHWKMLGKYYSQIGSCTNLEILTIKAAGLHPPDDEGCIVKISFWDTSLPGLQALEDGMSGQIGFLSKFADLPKLQELKGSFTVTTMEVAARMGERELDWFAHHLPSLKKAVFLTAPYQQKDSHDVPDIICGLQQRCPELELVDYVFI
ncbi:hypothetical protein BGW39_003372 [Mortierella sp. 14UC]|nr:hypothetical protein BGW39_003372 [Mortierella sp. 14UC]